MMYVTIDCCHFYFYFGKKRIPPPPLSPLSPPSKRISRNRKVGGVGFRESITRIRWTIVVIVWVWSDQATDRATDRGGGYS